ncbi:MAG: pilin [Gammaproteobacteria bacterium]|nr:pilin [Gammaproteobacteria bacterium]MBT8065522.1 pilin [Gammaproteobacteria bacterium]NNK32875.1 hypothetical protein [Xanthomonadales bacterium]
MNSRQSGFGGLQVLISIAAVAVLSVIAVPKYNAFIDKAKMTEAFNLAGESRRKLSEYYMVNARFPKTAAEAEPMRTVTLSPPDFVEGMVVEPASEEHDVVVKVYLKKDVFENVSGGEQYIYVAGDLTRGGASALAWSCGGSGVKAELLPEDCQG